MIKRSWEATKTMMLSSTTIKTTKSIASPRILIGISPNSPEIYSSRQSKSSHESTIPNMQRCRTWPRLQCLTMLSKWLTNILTSSPNSNRKRQKSWRKWNGRSERRRWRTTKRRRSSRKSRTRKTIRRTRQSKICLERANNLVRCPWSGRSRPK